MVIELPGEERRRTLGDTLALVGDRWTLLTIHTVAGGIQRFNDIQRHTGMPRDRLAARLKHLEGQGLIRRDLYLEHPPRFDYALTPKGAALLPAIELIKLWGQQFP